MFISKVFKRFGSVARRGKGPKLDLKLLKKNFLQNESGADPEPQPATGVSKGFKDPIISQPKIWDKPMSQGSKKILVSEKEMSGLDLPKREYSASESEPVTLERRDIMSQHSQDMNMIKRINGETNMGRLFRLHQEKPISLNALSHLFKRVIYIDGSQKRTRRLQATDTSKPRKLYEELWKNKEFMELSEKIYQNIENFTPLSLNIILGSLIKLKKLNVVLINIHTMMIKWLSYEGNHKFLDTEQLAMTFKNLGKIQYLETKYQ